MNLQILQEKIEKCFNVSELEDLCFKLNIEYADLSGNGPKDKSRELVNHCKRHGYLPDLLEKCKILRPNELWQEVAESTQQLAPEIREDKLSFLC